MIEEEKKAIEQAKRYIETDPGLAVFILRDLDVTEEAGMLDLAWAMHNHGCVKNDVVYLIEELEKHLDD